MKKLGTLFGKDLLLDTDDEHYFDLAKKHLKSMEKAFWELNDIIIEEEIKKFGLKKGKIHSFLSK